MLYLVAFSGCIIIIVYLMVYIVDFGCDLYYLYLTMYVFRDHSMVLSLAGTWCHGKKN